MKRKLDNKNQQTSEPIEISKKQKINKKLNENCHYKINYRSILKRLIITGHLHLHSNHHKN